MDKKYISGKGKKKREKGADYKLHKIKNVTRYQSLGMEEEKSEQGADYKVKKKNGMKQESLEMGRRREKREPNIN